MQPDSGRRVDRYKYRARVAIRPPVSAGPDPNDRQDGALPSRGLGGATKMTHSVESRSRTRGRDPVYASSRPLVPYPSRNRPRTYCTVSSSVSKGSRGVKASWRLAFDESTYQ